MPLSQPLTTDRVLAAQAGAAVGAIGTYAMLGTNQGVDYSPGATLAGSNLRYVGLTAGNWAFNGPTSGMGVAGSTTAPSGTWRCMGRAYGDSTPIGGASIWLRIA